jgi:hypothetical protein
MLLFAVMILSLGCEKNIRTKENVQAAILDRLRSRSGLDLQSLDITTTSLSFSRNMAYATVAFHPKDNPDVHSAMLIKYTLEARDGKWVVVTVGDTQGRGIGGQAPSASDQLPPGHPPIAPSPQRGETKPRP